MAKIYAICQVVIRKYVIVNSNFEQTKNESVSNREFSFVVKVSEQISRLFIDDFFCTLTPHLDRGCVTTNEQGCYENTNIRNFRFLQNWTN